MKIEAIAMGRESRRSLGVALLLGGAVLVLAVGLAYWFLVITASESLRQQSAATREAMTRAVFACPDRFVESVEPWSKGGWSRSCERDGDRAGPWEAWKNERLVIRGEYRDGQKQGSWTWFHPDGSPYRVIEYNEGQVLSNRIVSPRPQAAQQ